MRSIAFVLDDSNISGADLTNPGRGNPAIGGTEYSFASLAHELAVRGLARVTLIHRNPANAFSRTVAAISVANYPRGLPSALNQAGPVDCVVVRAHDSLPGSGVLQSIHDSIPVIAWAHNHLRSATLSYLARCAQIRRVVYVGREQCALAAGARCYFKSTHIPPGFYAPPPPSGKKEQRAVYVGSLVPQKGFHRLARLWPCIRRACPSAEIDVIGSVEVYHPLQRRGPLGLASPTYEKLILRYLRNDPARYGVVFHGKMALEKYGVMSRAIVGLPNPTGFTECCPASVVEMSGCQAAVVAMRQWGMCDTIVDQVTGFLPRGDREYVDRVVSLLRDPDAAQCMGTAGRRFVRDQFSYEVVCEQWARLLDEVLSSAAPRYFIPAITGSYPLRGLRVANNRLHSPRVHALLSLVDRVRGVFLKRY
jgi:glycosyltransferase involved in cell wall biosynthesis